MNLKVVFLCLLLTKSKRVVGKKRSPSVPVYTSYDCFPADCDRGDAKHDEERDEFKEWLCVSACCLVLGVKLLKICSLLACFGLLVLVWRKKVSQSVKIFECCG